MKSWNRRAFVARLLGFSTALGSARTIWPASGTPPTRSRQFSVPLVDDSGEVISRYCASSLYFSEDLGNNVSLEMALIPGGTFRMGSASNVPVPPFSMTEQPVHQVSVKPFALGVFPVTTGQWRKVASLSRIGRDLHQASAGEDLPVDVVSFDEAVEVCQRLRAYTGRSYRLPSEAEWEYACRAGTTTKYHFGDGISSDVANYNDGVVRPLTLTPVGGKRAPNRFGLHDMHGNVLEWCTDWAHRSYDAAPTDGSPWDYGSDLDSSGITLSSSRVGRGGMYLWDADIARSASRNHSDVCCTSGGVGIRLALDLPAVGLFDPTIHAGGVANAAIGVSGSVAPGEIVTVRGNSIGPSAPAFAAFDERAFVVTELSGMRLLFDGVPAPLLYASTDQVNAVVPYAISGKTSTVVMIDSQGQTSAPVIIPVATSDPAIFSADFSGRGQAAALNEDGSRNSIANPAPSGSVVTLFGTGEGQTDPPGVDGKPAGPRPPVPVLDVHVDLGGVACRIEYSGGAPGEVAGLFQINARIPEGIPRGQQPITLRVGRHSSQDGLFIVIA